MDIAGSALVEAFEEKECGDIVREAAKVLDMLITLAHATSPVDLQALYYIKLTAEFLQVYSNSLKKSSCLREKRSKRNERRTRRKQKRRTKRGERKTKK